MIEKCKLSSRFKNTTEQLKVPAKVSQVEVIKPEQNSNIDDVKQELMQKIYSIPVWFDYTEDEQLKLIKTFLAQKNITDDIEDLSNEIRGFGPLDYLISQDNVSAVFVNGTHGIHIDIGGRILNTEIKLSDKELQFLYKLILNKGKIKLEQPMMDFMVDNFRISIIMPEISQQGINISIRKYINYNKDELINSGMANKEIFDFIVSAVKLKKNIVISGDVNSGKTTFLNTLINSSVSDKQIVILEDSPQIRIASDTVMKFVCNKKSEYYFELLSQVLKMIPEYNIVDLNVPVSQFADNKGFITTIRASSVDSVMLKLTSEIVACENLTEKFAKGRVLKNYDYIVHIGKTEDGKRKIMSVVELKPAKTTALSVKTIAKFDNGEYVTDFS